MHVLISGGNKGIGLEISKLFIEAGWQVTILAKTASQCKLACNKIDYDLRKIEDIPDLVSKIGEIDVLINNASLLNGEIYSGYTKTQIDSILALNITAPVALMTAFSDVLKEKDGRIINISSIAADIGHPDVWYGITKAGLVNATKSFSKILAPNVTVNAVCPGPIATDMLAKIPKHRLDAFISNSSTGRVGEPHEVANTVYWLASSAPRQINGSVININGGITSL